MIRGDLVTVIIPTKDRLALLKEAVASVERQSLPKRRLVIVDDGSTDATWSWVEAQSSPDILAIRLDHSGERAAARNRGFDEVESPYVLFLDDDDRLTRDALAVLVGVLQRQPDAVAAVGAVEYFDDAGNRRPSPHSQPRRTRNMWQPAVFGWVARSGSAMFRTSVLRSLGGYASDLVVNEDRDLWLRISRIGPTAFTRHVVLEYRVHRDQWRPSDLPERERAMTGRHLATLLEADRRAGERIVRARHDFDEGSRAWADERPRAALRSFARTLRAPIGIVGWLFIHSRLGGRLCRAATGSLVGGRGMAIARRLRASGRRRRGVERWEIPAPREIDPTGRTER